MRAGGLVVFGVTVVSWGASIIVDIVCVLHQTMSGWQLFQSSMCTPHAIGGALEHHHTTVALRPIQIHAPQFIECRY